MTSYTKRDRARRTAIIGELVKLSRGGWANARAEDYAPLERELDRLNERRAIESRKAVRP